MTDAATGAALRSSRTNPPKNRKENEKNGDASKRTGKATRDRESGGRPRVRPGGFGLQKARGNVRGGFAAAKRLIGLKSEKPADRVKSSNRSGKRKCLEITPAGTVRGPSEGLRERLRQSE
jgi:hypothetical protein